MTAPQVDAPWLHSHDARLAYADTDPAGILYYASWFPKMERLQSEFLFLEGFRQDTLLAERGWQTITRATECEYLEAALLFDMIRIELRIGNIGTSSFTFDFQMTRRGDGARVARGAITLVTITPAAGPVRLPDELRAALDRWSTQGATHYETV